LKVIWLILVLFSISLVSISGFLISANAHIGSTLTGFGTATIDGVLSPGEWDAADTINFQANLPADEGGGTTPATLFVMNDANNLYLALRVERTSLDGGSFFFEFDNDHDGVREPGDEVIGTTTNGATNLDNFRTGGSSPTDTSDGGTNEGVSGSSNDGTFTVLERSHPLNSADDAHDFSLNNGDTVGFLLRYQILVAGTFPDNTGRTSLPLNTGLSQANNFGDILIATPILVGGEMIPLDATMVLAAGAQYTAAWMIPVLISAIGIGIVIARKF